jgi:hypothetical protein
MSKKDITPDKAPTNDAVPSKPADDPVLFEFVIYDGSTDSVDSEIKEDVDYYSNREEKKQFKLSYGDINQINLMPGSSVSSVIPENKVTKTLVFNGKARNVVLTEECTIAFNAFSTASSKDARTIQIFTEACITEGGKTYENYYNVRKSDQKIISFFSNDPDIRNRSGDLTSEQVVDLAKKWIAANFGEEIPDLYSHINVSPSGTNRYKLMFRRSIGGYVSDDRIIVNINNNGEIYSFNADSFGLYDHAINDQTNEKIDKAIGALREIYPSGKYTVNESSIEISMDQNGEFYVFAIILDASTNKAYRDVYIGINNQ